MSSQVVQPKTSSRRIARRLILALVLASSVITLFITALQLYRDYTRDLGLIEQRFKQIELVYVPSLSNALWKTDQQEIMLQLSGMMRMPDIQHLSVFEKGKIVAQAGESKQNNTITRTYTLAFSHRGDLRTIGEFVVVVTLEQVYQRLIDKVWVILISNAIKTFVIAGFMLFIFQLLVTRHINHLAAQLSDIDIDGLDKPLELQRRSSRDGKQDEFDILVKSFDAMRGKISDAVRKITQREEYLRRYESIMATTNDLMSYVDKDYKYQAVNAAYSDMYGKIENEIIGSTVSDLLGDEYFHNVAKPNLDKAFTGKHLQFISAVKNKYEEKVDVEVNYYPYYGGSDQVQGAVVNVRDITERLVAEQARLRNAQVYKALAQQGSIEFQKFVKSCLSLLLQVFASKYVMIGKLIPKTLQIQTQAVLIEGEMADNFIYDLKGTPCEKIFEHSRSFIYDNVIAKYPDDLLLEQFQAQTYFGIPLIDTRGYTMGVLVISDTKPHEPQEWHEDVLSAFAARISLEMERADTLVRLENYNEELESSVRIRTHELENSLKDLETFSYSVSHDLRTPLRAINGYSQLLIEDNKDVLDESSIDYLVKIKKASERMGELIDSLLKLSRIGRQTLELEEIDLSSMVQHSINEHSEHLLEQPLFEIDSGMHCTGDKGLLQVAIDNLISNAIKYSVNSTKPHIEFGQIREGNDLVYFIKDNGVGFDERYANKLFEPFQRLHDESEFQGLGIGLATVKRIFHRHGGRIWAESKDNQGATFYFTLGELKKYQVA